VVSSFPRPRIRTPPLRLSEECSLVRPSCGRANPGRSLSWISSPRALLCGVTLRGDELAHDGGIEGAVETKPWGPVLSCAWPA